MREVVNTTARVLRNLGVECVTFHDDTSHDVDTNLATIVAAHNKEHRDLDVSVHLNASDGKGHGCEVFYHSSGSPAVARDVVDAICAASGLTNRGPKPTSSLYVINHTDEPCILIEVCFCDNKNDCGIFEARFDDICGAIAGALAGEEAPADPPKPRPTPDDSERPTLAEGDAGPYVGVVQRVLGLPEDDEFGPVTDAGVRAFQGACGFSKDGVVGPKTWSALDDLAQRVIAGSDGIPPQLAERIDEIAAESPLQDFEWEGRGVAPDGYYAAMGKTFALALMRLEDGEDAATVMGESARGKNPDKDALAWYAAEFDDIEINVNKKGAETLRALFVLMVSLGMRESSGVSWEGRDLSADNVEADTAEASFLQTSWNIRSCSNTIPPLLTEYWTDPNGFRETFTRGLSPRADQLDCYGSGPGAQYQWLARYAPAFHALVSGVGLRRLRQHWGPINRKEATVERAVDDFLIDVQAVVEQAPDIA